jgi:hypothetical protein
LVGLTFLIVGTFVYWKRTDDQRALIFFFSCTMFGFARLLSMGPRHSEPTAEGALIMVAGTAVTFLFFPALLHFCLIFPRRRPILDRHPAVLRWIYGLPAGTAILLGGLGTFALLVHRRGDMRFQSLLTGIADTVSQQRGAATVALVAVLLPLAVFLVQRWRVALRSAGWRKSILDRPGLTIVTIAVLPAAVGSALHAGGFLFGSPAGFSRGVTTGMVVSLVAAFAAILRKQQSTVYQLNRFIFMKLVLLIQL